MRWKDENVELGIESGAYQRYGEDRHKAMYEDGYRYCNLNLADIARRLADMAE